MVCVSPDGADDTDYVWMDLVDYLFQEGVDSPDIGMAKWNVLDAYLNGVKQLGDPHQSYDPLFTYVNA